MELLLDGGMKPTAQTKSLQNFNLTHNYFPTALLTGAIDGSLGVPNSGYAQATPPLSAEQATALAEAERLNDQAVQLYQQGKFKEAIPLAEQALVIRRRILGENHPDVAQSLNNLAALYQDQGRYSEAEPLLQQALELLKRTLGENHPSVASSLSNLASLYQRQGRYVETEPLLKQALALRKRTLSENHPDIAISLNNLAALYESRGDAERAIEFSKQGMQIEELNLDINLVVGSEQQKQDYIAKISGTTNGAISLHFQAAINNPDAAHLALTAILQRKGRILDALTDNLNRLRQNLTPAD